MPSVIISSSTLFAMPSVSLSLSERFEALPDLYASDICVVAFMTYSPPTVTSFSCATSSVSSLPALSSSAFTLKMVNTFSAKSKTSITGVTTYIILISFLFM